MFRYIQLRFFILQKAIEYFIIFGEKKDIKPMWHLIKIFYKSIKEEDIQNVCDF